MAKRMVTTKTGTRTMKITTKTRLVKSRRRLNHWLLKAMNNRSVKTLMKKQTGTVEEDPR